MKKHKTNYRKLAVLFGFFFLPLLSSFGQTPGSNCANAITILTTQCLNHADTLESWFTFTGDSASKSIRTYHSSQIGTGKVTQINVYSGTCSGLTPFGSKSLVNSSDTSIIYDTTGYQYGATYFVQCIIQPPSGCPNCPTNFSVCVLNTTTVNYYNGFAAPEVFEDCGLNFAFEGVQMNQRHSWTPATAPPGIGNPQPNTIAINTIPAGAAIVKAYLYFIMVGFQSNTCTFSLTNPNSNTLNTVANVADGGAAQYFLSTCWQPAGYVDTKTFKADVTSIISGNGNYIVNNIPLTYTIGTQTYNLDVDGAALLIVYKDDCNQLGSKPKGKLVLRDGLSMIGGGTSNPLGINFTSYPINQNGRFFYAIGDVQSNAGTNQTIVNNNVCAQQFWQVTTLNQGFAPNSTGHFTTHNNNGSDCSALGVFGVYFQDVPLCNPITANAGADVDICFGQSVNLNGTATGSTSSYWTNLNGDTICYPCSSTTINPLLSSGAIFWVDNGIGCAVSDTMYYHLTYLSGLDLVALPGNQANVACDTVTYTVTGAPPGSTFAWTASNGNQSTGTTYTVFWNNNPGYMSVIVTTPDGCLFYDTLHVVPCCFDDNLVWTNRSVSSLLTDPQFTGLFNGTTINFPGGDIVINGILTVDTTLTILNCHLLEMGANAKIDVLPGKYLQLSNCQTQNKCGFMWDGIYVTDISATVRIDSNSIIQYSRNCVVSINGGKYYIENATLRDNYRDIIVGKYQSGSHQSYVRATTFTMQNGFLPALYPSLPSGHTQTVAAIEIEDNRDITIGDASNTGYQNTFRKVLIGVRSRFSQTKVVNCYFDNLNPTNIVQQNLPDNGTAVIATGGKPIPYQPRLQVGGSNPLDVCVMNDVRHAVVARDKLNIEVRGNQLTQIRVGGISVFRCPSLLVDITDNTISNPNSFNASFSRGIEVTDCYNSQVNILANTIQQRGGVPGVQVGTGIIVQNASPGIVLLNIGQNDPIVKVKTGIHLLNIDGRNGASVYSNRVVFQKANADYSSPHYGIRLEDCINLWCDTNRVIKTNAVAPTLAMQQNLRGISVENSPGSIVTDNVFTRTGSGIYAWGLSSASTFACNIFDANYNGVFLTGPASTNFAADIGDQIVDPFNIASATGNTWTANVALNEIDGDATPTIWRWDNVAPANGANNVFPQQESYNACSQYFFGSQQVAIRDKEAGATLRLLEQGGQAPEQDYLMRKYVHRKLRQNPNWLNLNTPDDSLYQQFYAVYNPSNLGTLRTVELLATIGTAQSVAGICNTVSCSNLIEYNLKTVYSIYSNTWMKNITEFTPADSATLLGIALQDPVEGGNGVINARVMLGLDMDYYGGSNHAMQSEQEQPESSVVVYPAYRMYPNPAKNLLNIELDEPEIKAGNVQIFNIQGQLVASQTIVHGQRKAEVNTTSLLPGVYAVQVMVNGITKDTQRLVIFR